MLGFVFGALAGSFAAYFYRDQISHYVNRQFPALRDRAVDGLGTIGHRANTALDRARTSIDSTVRASQERLRATGTTETTGGTFGQGTHEPDRGYGERPGGPSQRPGMGGPGTQRPSGM